MKKHLFLAALILAASTVSAADPGEVTQQKDKAAAVQKPHRPRHLRRPPPSREEFLSGPGIWRAFAMMSAEEQKEMR
jgi:hypothetical protein